MPPFCEVKDNQCVLKSDRATFMYRISESPAPASFAETCSTFSAEECTLMSRTCDNPDEVYTEVGCKPKPWTDWADCSEELRQQACPHMADPNPKVYELCPYSCAKDHLPDIKCAFIEELGAKMCALDTASSTQWLGGGTRWSDLHEELNVTDVPLSEVQACHTQNATLDQVFCDTGEQAIGDIRAKISELPSKAKSLFHSERIEVNGEYFNVAPNSVVSNLICFPPELPGVVADALEASTSAKFVDCFASENAASEFGVDAASAPPPSGTCWVDTSRRKVSCMVNEGDDFMPVLNSLTI